MRKLLLIALLVFPPLVIGQQASDPRCPQISVMGPSGIPDFKKPIVFVATVGDEMQKFNPTYVWTTSTGEIVDGQGTLTVSVLHNDPRFSLTVTLEVKGLPEHCPNAASEAMIIDPAPVAIKLDEIIGSLAKVPVERFVAAFKQAKDNPTAQVYIFISGSRRNPQSSIKRKRDIMMKHIPITCQYDTQRVTFIDSGKQDDRVTIWLVPAGANSPTP